MNGNHRVPSGFAAHDRRGGWFAVISGERRGIEATLERAALALLAILYRAALATHNLAWRLFGSVKRAPCPVISVGNITVGGTGKTPMVAYLAHLASEMGRRPLILSRGYGGQAGRPNEEARELERLCPGVPHVQNPDRVRAMEEGLSRNQCDLIILDDGFQHRRLGRDLDIVLIDALQPFGFGRLLPRGLLREPLPALARADMVVITRAELVDAADLGRIKESVGLYVRPDTPILVAEHRPGALVMLDGSRRPAESLRGQDIAAACGIGNPEAFRRTIAQLGANVQYFEAFADHHAYTRADLDRLIAAAAAAGCKTLVTTGKDYVKWQPLLEGQASPGVEIAALEVELRVVEGEEALRQRLGSILSA
jgi:tetraacyldisaccharide 4'-kinase